MLNHEINKQKRVAEAKKQKHSNHFMPHKIGWIIAGLIFVIRLFASFVGMDGGRNKKSSPNDTTNTRERKKTNTS